MPSHVQGATSVYNAGQLGILDAYFLEVYNGTTLNHLSLYYAYAKNLVEDSNLTLSEKYVVMAAVELGNKYAKRHFAGAWSSIRSDVAASLSASASGCTVNWKSVWQGAVLGTIGGAVSGF